MLDKVYFALSLIFIVVGILGIFLPEIPGLISSYCGVLLFTLLTQFRDISFDLVIKYGVLAVLVWLANTYWIKREQLQYNKKFLAVGALAIILLILTKRHELLPLAVVIAYALAQVWQSKDYFKTAVNDLKAWLSLGMEGWISQVMITDFITRVVSKF